LVLESAKALFDFYNGWILKSSSSSAAFLDVAAGLIACTCFLLIDEFKSGFSAFFSAANLAKELGADPASPSLSCFLADFG